ncbi:MAG: leucine--tRNA ligase [Chloroflexota bacterium]|nr:leucine--tRNA ligase [Chloroflexota bacterium]
MGENVEKPANYNPQEIEPKWQARWAETHLYEVEEDAPRPKWYALTMFPYTSGDLHVGHWYAMAPSDVHARFKRMKGYNVLHPIGFDAFGLPAENAAIKRGIHPYKWTMDNVERMREQLKRMGSMYDWRREVITCLPEYYRWTQWFFLKLYEGGLAYRDKAPVNWCPKCQTVLANEQVVGEGICERCDTPVIRKDLEQWFFRITRYVDELLDFGGTEWPERIKAMQANWIGKSRGVEISFGLENGGGFSVFTTRIDTIYGVTFVVLAPEHPLVAELTTPDRREEVERYIESTRRQSEIERTSTEREKTGVFIGEYAINKLNGERVPVFIADYVLMSYGTGAVMAVPAHDQRDFAFAGKFDLPIRVVIAPPDWNGGELTEAHTEAGTMVNSAHFGGMPSDKAIESIADYVEEKGYGERKITYRIRDWLISRQRYWGAPIPMIYCDKCGVVPVPEGDLPVLLPEDAEFKPTGESPLKYCESFVNTTCPQCNSPARRETDTMDTFMCSSWYFLRYTSPGCFTCSADPAKMGYWMPVDQYTGGAEHAVMHLLYSRFFVKAICDLGIVDFDEPFTRLFNQGIVISGGQKMSKSRGNVIAPDDYVSTLGADSVRTYLMFIGPWDQGGEWDDRGIKGIARWLNRVWAVVIGSYEPAEEDEAQTRELRHITHKTIKKVHDDLERFHYNTMIAALMELTNHLGKVREERAASELAYNEATEALMLLLAPTAPHLAEEMWERTGRPYSIHNMSFPEWHENLVAVEEFTLVIQVNGKVRDKVTAPVTISEDEAKEMALRREKITSYIEGAKSIKVIYVPQKLVNIATT